MSRARSKQTTSGTENAESPIEQCRLVQDEVWRIVSRAAETETHLSVWKQAETIVTAFPASGLSLQNIADALVFAAVDRGATLELTSPAPASAIPTLFLRIGRKRSPDNRTKVPRSASGVAIPATA